MTPPPKTPDRALLETGRTEDVDTFKAQADAFMDWVAAIPDSVNSTQNAKPGAQK